MKIETTVGGWSSYNMVCTSSANVMYYDPDQIARLKKATPYVSNTPYRAPVYQKPFEPVIHTGNEDVLTWVPQVFGALLCTEIILIGYWLVHLIR